MNDIRLVSYCNNKAQLLYYCGRVLMFSYETLIAFYNEDGWFRTIKDNDIDEVVSNTTARHIKEMFSECCVDGMNKKSYSQLKYREY